MLIMESLPLFQIPYVLLFCVPGYETFKCKAVFQIPVFGSAYPREFTDSKTPIYELPTMDQA